jgi:hypothetical protein
MTRGTLEALLMHPRVRGSSLVLAKDRYGALPLHYAALRGNAHLLAVLLAHGALNGLHVFDMYHRTPLMHAVMSDSVLSVGILLGHGALALSPTHHDLVAAGLSLESYHNAIFSRVEAKKRAVLFDLLFAGGFDFFTTERQLMIAKRCNSVVAPQLTPLFKCSVEAGLSLSNLCRLQVRAMMGFMHLSSIHVLPISHQLQRYLFYNMNILCDGPSSSLEHFPDPHAAPSLAIDGSDDRQLDAFDNDGDDDDDDDDDEFYYSEDDLGEGEDDDFF